MCIPLKQGHTSPYTGEINTDKNAIQSTGPIQILSTILTLFPFLFWPRVPYRREGNGTPLQYSCLENPREPGGTTERLHFDFSLSYIEGGNGNPLQCSCLENPRDGEAWWAAVYGVAQSRTRLKQLSSSSSN